MRLTRSYTHGASHQPLLGDTIGDALDRTVASAPDAEALVVRHQGVRWTWAELRSLDRNGGFSYGNNAAVRLLLSSPNPPRHIWLLNPDTLVRPGAVTALVDFLEGRPDVGIVGGRLEYPDATPQTAAFRFPSLAGEFEDTIRLGFISRALERYRVPPPPRDVAHPTDWVNGASMMVRREAFVRAGGFRAGFGKLGDRNRPEDTELCLRLSAATGGRWMYVPDAVIEHEVPVGRSTFRFFLRRCYAEGRGKVQMAALLPHTQRLGAERDYLRRTLPRAVLRDLAAAGRGQGAWHVLRAATVVAAVAAAGWGGGVHLPLRSTLSQCDRPVRRVDRRGAAKRRVERPPSARRSACARCPLHGRAR